MSLGIGGWIIIWFMFCHLTFTGQQARLWSHLIILQPMVSTLIFSNLSLLNVIFKNYFPCFLDIKEPFVLFSRFSHWFLHSNYSEPQIFNIAMGRLIILGTRTQP